MALKLSDWERVGIIGVDAGICWIGDPCYIIHKDKPYRELGKDWSEFCNKLPDSSSMTTQFNYDKGHPGLGVVVPTGWGDGSYPVYVRRTFDKRIAEVKVVFQSDEDTEEDDSWDTDSNWEDFDH